MDDRRIHLLFIVNSLCVGGAEKHAVTLANTLDRGRYRLSLAYLKDEAPLLPQIDRENVENRIHCCHVSRKIDGAVVRALATMVRDERLDIIVCVNTYSLMYAQLARRLSGRAPRIVELFHTTELGSIKDQLQMLFYRPFIGCSDMLVYVCRNQQRYWRLRLLRARRDGVIHNGIDSRYFADHFSAAEKRELRHVYGFSETDHVVGLCAAMRPEKAHGDLLQAIALLGKDDLAVKCLLIGDGPERGRIERRVQELGLGEAVRITGFLTDVRPAIAACDVMAITSHHVETFSIAALESMAMSKPMIMTRIGGASEQVSHGESGYLYERGDVAALAAALRALSNRGLATRMGQAARSAVERSFSLTTMVRAYDRLFSGLLDMPLANPGNVHAA